MNTSFNPIDSTGKFKIKNCKTGQYLVAPVSAWRELCNPEWTDIPESGFGFSDIQSIENISFLWRNLKIKAERIRLK